MKALRPLFLIIPLIAIFAARYAQGDTVVAVGITSISVSGDGPNRTYAITKDTSISLNNNSAEVGDLMVGMKAVITPDSNRPNAAQSIVATGKERAVFDGEIGFKAQKHKRNDPKPIKTRKMFGKISSGSDGRILATGASGFTVSVAGEGSKVYKISSQTTYTVGGRDATREEVVVGMSAEFDVDPDTGFATSVRATSPVKPPK